MHIYRTISVACFLTVFIYSCNKSNSSITQPPPPPPAGGSGISISSVSPLTPYYGDVITINGTGFDADMTKDTVTLVNSDGTNFTNLYGVSGVRFKIISATTTQIKFVTDSLFLIPSSLPQTVAVHVKFPLGSGLTKNILTFKRNVTFGIDVSDPGPNPGCLAIYAGDSILLSGQGLYPPLTVTINGMSTNIKADANSITSARGFLPLSFFGLTRQVQCTDDKLYAVKVVNGDGRTFSNPRYCFEGPNSALNQPFAIGLSYSLSSTTTALVNLTGYALRDDYSLALSSLDNASNTRYSENLAVPVSAGFPNQASFNIDLTQFPKPTTSLGTAVSYILRIGNATNGTVIGFGVAFIIYP
jgi:IPT/TIG domain